MMDPGMAKAYEEIADELTVEQRLARLTVEQRLVGLTPEQLDEFVTLARVKLKSREIAAERTPS